MVIRKWHVMVILAVLTAFVVAGCTPQPPVVPAVEPQFTVITAPGSGTVGEKIEFNWGITAEEGTIAASTAVRYGKGSTLGELGKDIAPADTTYDRAPTAYTSVTLPDTFISALWTGSEGMLYYRFHAVIEGENYWSDEYSIEIAPEAEEVEVAEPTVPSEPSVPEPAPEPEQEPEEAELHAIIVKDDVFDPEELTIKVGDTVQWKNEREPAQATRGSALLIWHSRSDGYSSVDFPNGKTFYPGETWEFTFEKEGKLGYTDAIFINAGIIGIINVEP